MRILLYLREFVKKENIGYYLKEFNISERFSAVELKKLQGKKLLELLLYLKKHNSHYSKYLQDNHIQLKEDLEYDPYYILKKLPIVDKQHINKHKQEWLTLNEKSKLTKASTSGSTGMPFELYHSSVSRDIKASLKCRLLDWHGVKRWEKQLYYGCTYSAQHSKLSSMKKYLNNRYVWNRIVIDITKINKENIEKEIARINKLQPVTIWGYPSFIYEIAHYSLQNNFPIKNDKLKMIIFSGESHNTYIKNVVYQAFQINPADEYNSNEGFIAGTCEFQKLHLNDDAVIAEILDDKGEVTEYGMGELLVTHLFSYDFPFIRYKTGDIVEISKENCICGRNLKVVKSVNGRTGSVIYNGNDKISNATCNHYVTKSLDMVGLEKYQIVQDNLSSVIIKLVVSDNIFDSSRFELHMRDLFDKIDVKFEYVNDIPRDKSGKYRDVINNVG